MYIHKQRYLHFLMAIHFFAGKQRSVRGREVKLDCHFQTEVIFYSVPAPGGGLETFMLSNQQNRFSHE